MQQDLRPESHEILVFNNSDGLLPNTDWLSAPQVKIVNTHSNVNDASNKGAAMACGKYVNFLHDDDYLQPGALKALVAAADTSQRLWVCGAWDLVDDDSNYMSTVRPEVKGNMFAPLVAGECLHLAAMVINRDAFLQVGGFDLEIFGQSDIDLESQLALISDYEAVDQLVATVRVSGGKGKTHDWTNRTKQDFRRMREKALSSNGALARMMDSVSGDVFLRGRACRSYLFSAALNIRDRQFIVANRRLISLVRLAGYHPLRPSFWRGLIYRSHWHNVQKGEQEEYFRAHYPSEEKGFWRV
jgi:GT2 family glycosyltransferase